MARISRLLVFAGLGALLVLGPSPLARGPGAEVLGDLTPAVVAAAQPAAGAASDAQGQPPSMGEVQGTAGVMGGGPQPGVTYRSYPGVAFRPRNSTMPFTYTAMGSIGQSAANSDYYAVQLDLPKGARITEVIWYFYDNDATYDMTMVLTRWGNAGTGIEDVAGFVSSGSSAVVQGAFANPPTPLTVDGTASTYVLQASLGSGGGGLRLYGARVGYVAPAQELVAIPPARVLDTRFSGKPLQQGTGLAVTVHDAIDPVTGQVTMADVVPPGTAAIAYNLTVVEPTASAGFLALTPGTSTTVTASAINWSSAGVILANGGVVSLAGDRMLTIVAGGGSGWVHVVLDVTGYYTAP